MSRLASTYLDSDDLAILERENILIAPPTIGGKRRVSGAWLSPPDSERSYSRTSSRSTASLSLHNFDNHAPTDISLPLEEESAEALEWVGFTAATANMILSRYALRADSPYALLSYALSYVRSVDPKERLPPLEMMTRMGLTVDLQTRLTDPRFEEIASTQTLHYWIRDTVRINFRTMQMHQKQLKQAAVYIRSKKKAKRASVQDAFAPLLFTVSLTSSQPTIPTSLNFPAEHVKMEAAGPILPDHQVLYKGKAFDPDHDPFIINEDGSVSNRSFPTPPGGGDFNHLSNAYYWTPDRECAEQYRKWAELRNWTSTTLLIRIQIPTSVITPLRKEELWVSPDWKQYVWICRKDMEMPPKYNKYWNGTDLVVGHVLKKVSEHLTNDPQKVQSSITAEPDWVLNNPDKSKAKQWCFSSDAYSKVCAEIVGKMHIEITDTGLARESVGESDGL